MNPTTLDISAGSPNTLSVPRAVRDYVNERGEGRSFSLESLRAQHIFQPHQIVVDFRVSPTGAEQIEPFTVTLVLSESEQSSWRKLSPWRCRKMSVADRRNVHNCRFLNRLTGDKMTRRGEGLRFNELITKLWLFSIESPLLLFFSALRGEKRRAG